MTPKGQSRCTFISWTMVTPGPICNRYGVMIDFHFRDLEMTPLRSPTVKSVFGFRKSDTDFPILFHCNHRSNSHRFEAGADVCSTERRVDPLSLPLIENGLTDLDAVWRIFCKPMSPGGIPVSLRRNHDATDRHLATIHDCVRQTDRRQTTL